MATYLGSKLLIPVILGILKLAHVHVVCIDEVNALVSCMANLGRVIWYDLQQHEQAYSTIFETWRLQAFVKRT
jgi:hypothetical protein